MLLILASQRFHINIQWWSKCTEYDKNIKVLFSKSYWLDYVNKEILLFCIYLLLRKIQNVRLKINTLVPRFVSLIWHEETRHKPKQRKMKHDFLYIRIDFRLIGSEIHNFSWKNRFFNKKISNFSLIVFIMYICVYVFTLDLNGKSPFVCFSFVQTFSY